VKSVTTEEILRYLAATGTGILLGTIFFGGLWLTVRRLPSARHPALLMIGSLLLRTAIVLAGIWYVGAGHAGSMMACLLGIVAARFLATSVLSNGLPAASTATLSGSGSGRERQAQ
jgi:F1F0 ATPase subunit 2